MSITVREYRDFDEIGWVRCRLISFLDSSYYDDIKREKEQYDNPSICLVTEDNNQIVGFIDVEYEETIGEVCCLNGDLGATIWNLGVMPEYRNQKIAQELWNQAKQFLIEKGIKRIEVWTQDDVQANGWYQKQGFKFIKSYLNVFAYGDCKDKSKSNINHQNIGNILGIRCLNFEAPIERREEFISRGRRVHEVKLYELKL